MTDDKQLLQFISVNEKYYANTNIQPKTKVALAKLLIYISEGIGKFTSEYDALNTFMRSLEPEDIDIGYTRFGLSSLERTISGSLSSTTDKLSERSEKDLEIIQKILDKKNLSIDSVYYSDSELDIYLEDKKDNKMRMVINFEFHLPKITLSYRHINVEFSYTLRQSDQVISTVS